MTVALTDRQAEILAFINLFRGKEQCNPTMNEIALAFEFGSANAASDHLKALIKKGVVKHRASRARGYIVCWPYSEGKT